MSTPATEDLAQPSGIYSPLDSNKQSLRLFRIHPGSGDLKLKLERFCLDSDECPPFAALSYMWGDAPTHQDITINDRTFSITHNAFLFLNTLRKHQARRHLEWIWMDSICINQADPNERNHQVRLMQKIYGLAEHVFFHIGEETQLAEKAFDLKYTKIDGQLWRRWENGGLPKIVMLDLVRVFNGSRYSRRLWIVQELVLGRQVS
ncbi:heterokaryon incompatibility protein-domain-containing protein, partial [Immersiella caudata]